jgi:hypothetical protein
MSDQPTFDVIDGATIMGAVLRDYAPLLKLIEPRNIRGGRLAEDQPLPAILVRTVSSIDAKRLTRSATRRCIDRISVAVRAASWAEQRAIIRAVRDAGADRVGQIGGGLNVSILLNGLGPDVDGPGNTYEQSQDFRVTYDALSGE